MSLLLVAQLKEAQNQEMLENIKENLSDFDSTGTLENLAVRQY